MVKKCPLIRLYSETPMSHMLKIVLLAALAISLTGCIGNGALLQDFSCKGKATIVGGGSGFSGVNGTIDCGEGFTLTSGTKGNQDIVNLPNPNALAPVKVPLR